MITLLKFAQTEKKKKNKHTHKQIRLQMQSTFSLGSIYLLKTSGKINMSYATNLSHFCSHPFSVMPKCDRAHIWCVHDFKRSKGKKKQLSISIDFIKTVKKTCVCVMNIGD